MSSTNSDSFTSSLPIWIPFISFSYLIYCLTSNTLLSVSGENGRSCFFLNSVEGFQLFTAEYYVCCGFILNGLYYIEICSLSTNFDEFLSWMDVKFCQMLFLRLLRWSCDFYLSFCSWSIPPHWLIFRCWTILVTLE